MTMHPLVVNVKDPGATWDVYVGRGHCPCCGGVTHAPNKLGNPFRVQDFNGNLSRCMELFFDWIQALWVEDVPLCDKIRALKGKRLGCWCVGRYPACHAEVYARLAAGENLWVIRADVMDRVRAWSRCKPADVTYDLFGGEP